MKFSHETKQALKGIRAVRQEQRAPHHHVLKTHPEFFREWIGRRKDFEIRRDDREPKFMAGDTVEQQEFDPATSKFSGRVGIGRIGYVLRGFQGLAKGFCALQCPFEKMKVVHGKTDEMIANDLNQF